MTTQAVVHTIYTKTQLDELEEISEVLKSKDLEIIGGMRMCLEKAIEAGELLLKAKKIVKHGEFEDWCTRKTKYTFRRCQQWMTLAKKRTNFAFDTTEPVYKLLQAGRTKTKPGTNGSAPKASDFGFKLVLTRDQRRACNKKVGRPVDEKGKAPKELMEWAIGVLEKAVG